MGIPDGPDDASATRRGRPPLDTATREALILDALEHVMADTGLRGASMSAVARTAGMSKRTLYTLYSGRDALFEAWMGRLRTMLVRPLTPEDRSRPLKERLCLLLRREVEQCMSERRLAVLRALVAEAPSYPELARAIFREGAFSARRLVTEELRRAADADEITVGDVQVAADILFDMAYQNPLEYLINPDAVLPEHTAAETRLQQAIDIFLQGVARS